MMFLFYGCLLWSYIYKEILVLKSGFIIIGENLEYNNNNSLVIGMFIYVVEYVII